MNPKVSYVLSAQETFLLTHCDLIHQEFQVLQHNYLQCLHVNPQLPVLVTVSMSPLPLFHHLLHQYHHLRFHLDHRLQRYLHLHCPYFYCSSFSGMQAFVISLKPLGTTFMLERTTKCINNFAATTIWLKHFVCSRWSADVLVNLWVILQNWSVVLGYDYILKFPFFVTPPPPSSSFEFDNSS